MPPDGEATGRRRDPDTIDDLTALLAARLGELNATTESGQLMLDSLTGAFQTP